MTEDTLIGIFDKWWPNYEIRFEVKVDSFGSRPGLLLLFTAKNGDCQFFCSKGQYIPAVFTRKIKILKFILNIDYLEDPDENSLKLMTSGPKGTAPSGSIKGLQEGEWYEIVISQQKEWVNKLFFKNEDVVTNRFFRLVTPSNCQ